MKQWTGSKLGKKYIKAVYCHPAYLTYMQSTSCKCQAGFGISNPAQARIKIARRNQQSQICRLQHPDAGKQRGAKEPLDEREKRDLKNWLKNQHSKN